MSIVVASLERYTLNNEDKNNWMNKLLKVQLNTYPNSAKSGNYHELL